MLKTIKYIVQTETYIADESITILMVELFHLDNADW